MITVHTGGQEAGHGVQVMGLKGPVYRIHNLLETLEPSPISYQHFQEQSCIITVVPTQINNHTHTSRHEKCILLI